VREQQKGIGLALKRSSFFDILAFENAKGSLHDKYPHLFVIRESEGPIDLMNLNEKQIQNFTPVNGPERYVPSGFPDDLHEYSIGNSGSLTLSRDEKKVLRIQIKSTSGEKWKVGLSRSNMKSLPISITDLKELFGEGELFNKLVK